jgi:hypothetical protein
MHPDMALEGTALSAAPEGGGRELRGIVDPKLFFDPGALLDHCFQSRAEKFVFLLLELFA